MYSYVPMTLPTSSRWRQWRQEIDAEGVIRIDKSSACTLLFIWHVNVRTHAHLLGPTPIRLLSLCQPNAAPLHCFHFLWPRHYCFMSCVVATVFNSKIIDPQRLNPPPRRSVTKRSNENNWFLPVVEPKLQAAQNSESDRTTTLQCWW